MDDSWQGAWGFAWDESWGEQGAENSGSIVGDTSAPSSNVVHFDAVRSACHSIDGGPIYESGPEQDMVDITAVLTALFASNIRKAA